MSIFDLPPITDGLQITYPRPGGDEREIETMLIYDPTRRQGYKGEHTVPYRTFRRNVGSFLRPRWKEYRIIDEDGLAEQRRRTFERAYRELNASHEVSA